MDEVLRDLTKSVATIGGSAQPNQVFDPQYHPFPRPLLVHTRPPPRR